MIFIYDKKELECDYDKPFFPFTPWLIELLQVSCGVLFVVSTYVEPATIQWLGMTWEFYVTSALTGST